MIDHLDVCIIVPATYILIYRSTDVFTFCKESGSDYGTGRGFPDCFDTASIRATARSTTGTWRGGGNWSTGRTWSDRSSRSAAHLPFRRHERRTSLCSVRFLEGKQ